MKNKDLYIGIDIALNTSGYAILDKNKKIISTGLIETKKHWGYYKKISFINDKFKELFEEITKKQPNSVTLILEGRLKGGFSGQTLASIEGARVSCYLAFQEITEGFLEPFVYNPNEVKYHFSRKRGATKEEMKKSVSKKYRKMHSLPYQEDIFDAIYLCLYHLEKET